MPVPLLHLSFTLNIDYCNSLLLNIPVAQTNRLRLILNSAARAVTKIPNFHHNSPTFKSLH